MIFALIIGNPAWLLAVLGQYLLKLRGYAPRAGLGIILGIAVTVCQYPFELLGRKLFPASAQSFLSIYLVVAVLLCVAVLLRDMRSKKLHSALNPNSMHV